MLDTVSNSWITHFITHLISFLKWWWDVSLEEYIFCISKCDTLIFSSLRFRACRFFLWRCCVTQRLRCDDEELMYRSCVVTKNLFSLQIVDSGISKQALSEIESRHKDIVRLESSIKELHDMFVDIAMLVESQVHSSASTYSSLHHSISYFKKPISNEFIHSSTHFTFDSFPWLCTQTIFSASGVVSLSICMFLFPLFQLHAFLISPFTLLCHLHLITLHWWNLHLVRCMNEPTL